MYLTRRGSYNDDRIWEDRQFSIRSCMKDEGFEYTVVPYAADFFDPADGRTRRYEPTWIAEYGLGLSTVSIHVDLLPGDSVN